MFDYKKLQAVKKTIRSFSADDLQEWIDMDRKRMALVEQEENAYQPVQRMAVGKLNGSPQVSAKSKNVSAKSTTSATKPKTHLVRARNSAKSRATANTW